MTGRPDCVDWPDRRVLAERIFARYQDIVDDSDSLFEALMRPLHQTIWVNALRIDREALIDMLREDGLDAVSMAWNPLGLRLPAGARPGLHWGFFAGLFQVQEEVSMVPVYCLAPRAGDRVLDLCAAPGNKTAQMAVAMSNQGTVVANDQSRGRIPAIRQAVKRLGLTNVCITIRDGQGIDDRAGTFDRVLIDAPCTCEGTFRKSAVPQVVSDEVRRRAANVQLRLLRRGLALLRPGGRLVYATCTFSPEENEAVVDAVLRENEGDLRLLPVSVPGLRVSPGLASWRGQTFLPALGSAGRFWPHHNDTGGFFVAVMEKVGDPDANDGGTGVPHVPVADEDDAWLAPFRERFGVDLQALAGQRLIRRGGRHVHLLSADHRAPVAPAPDALGLPLVRRKSLPLKPTTAAVMLLGAQATRNRVDLSQLQFDRYRRREPQCLLQHQLQQCSGPGHVIVTFRGRPVGLGQLVYDRDSPTVRLLSFMPKAWVPAEA